jgi:type IV pilus assembly protein PilE
MIRYGFTFREAYATRTTFKRLKSKLGFTLLELMIVAVVIAVLAAIALPSYQSYVIKARRSDAKEALIRLALHQERFRANFPCYARDIQDALPADSDANGGINLAECQSGGLGLSTIDTFSDEQYYQLSIEPATTDTNAVDFLLKAAPVAGKTQEKDTACALMELERQPDDAEKEKRPPECWR